MMAETFTRRLNSQRFPHDTRGVLEFVIAEGAQGQNDGVVLDADDDGQVGVTQAAFHFFRGHAIGFYGQGPARQDDIRAGTTADAVVYRTQ